MRRSLFLFLWMAMGCTSQTGPDRIRVLGAIMGYNLDDPRIEIVQDQRTVTVRVTTYGNGCYSQGETETAVEGLEANIRPWDYTFSARSDRACPDVLLSFVHEAVLRFDDAGTVRIRVRGIDAGQAAGGSRGEVVTVERTVAVP
jgi:hypothetical protein